MPEAYEFSESERGIFDAIDATHNVLELRTLMQPIWDNPTIGIDVLWHLHCERQKKMEEERLLIREREQKERERQIGRKHRRLGLLERYTKKKVLGKAGLKVVERIRRMFKHKW